MQIAITVCLLVVFGIAVAIHHDELQGPQLFNQMKVKRSVMNGIPYAYGYHHVPIEPLMADNYERFAESQSDATAYSAYQPAAKSFWSSSQLSGPSYAFQKPVAAPENRVNSDVVYRTLMQRAAGRGASAETAQDRGNGNVAIQLTANVVYDYERPTVHHQSMTGYQPSDVAEPRDMLYDEAAKVAAGRKSAMFFTEDIAGVAPFLIVALASGESSEEKNTATGATTAATPAPTAAAPNVFRTLFDEYYDAEAKTADMDRNTYTVITDDEAKTGDLPTKNDDFLVIVDNGESSESTTPAADEVNSASDSSESSDSEPATTAEPNYDEATLVNGLDLMVMVIDEKRQDDQAYDTETNNIAGRSTDNEIVSISSEEITTQSPATAALDVEEHDGHLSDEENAWERAIYVAHQTEAPDAEEDDNMVVTTTEGEPDEILAELRRRLLDQYPSLNAPEETTTPEEEPTTPSTESEQDTTSSSVDVDAGESVFEEEEDWER